DVGERLVYAVRSPRRDVGRGFLRVDAHAYGRRPATALRIIARTRAGDSANRRLGFVVYRVAQLTSGLRSARVVRVVPRLGDDGADPVRARAVGLARHQSRRWPRRVGGRTYALLIVRCCPRPCDAASQ